MNESQLWQKINTLQKTQKLWHFTRIESATIRGIPDVNCLINGFEFWIELKSKESKNLGLSNYQINWHIKYQRAGGKVYILNSPLKQRALEILVVNRDSRCVDLVATSSLTTTQGIWDLLLETAGAAS